MKTAALLLAAASLATPLGVAAWGKLPWFVPAWIWSLSLITFIFYAHDKRRAHTRGWRVPERTLHGLAALGGWPGALIAQQRLRHKTIKRPFQRVTWAIVTLHLLVWISAGALITMKALKV